MRVSDMMAAPAVCVAPRTPMEEVARRMAEHGVGCVLVVENGTLRGIVTDRDLALRGLGGGLAPTTPVQEAMTARVVAVDADDDVKAAYQAFRRTGVRRLPVLHAGRVVGVLTVDDLFLDVFGRLGDLLGPLSSSVLREPPGPASRPENPRVP
ncbi:cyclic nucleotide-binding/CBS domain-containing protein [Streptomyces mangrovisoli]|uniref:Histidine kinase n=1 Tax=Streptomyces mangrovisoli TaxID=1428628 RepID=A0A1J4NNG7_9ACTN|nr:CBS domain-containing protein [Streptomyces mangrovisoli]OIJ63848.1 histidine kinase [Streptomyces mangrovisoli]